MLKRVVASREALEELSKRGVKEVRVRLVEEESEWTMCCIGSVCAILPRVVVEEGRGEGDKFEVFEVDGIEVYVSKEVSSRAKGDIELVVERGELRVKGVELEGLYVIKPASASGLPKWA
ncbi:MAG: hypothetical protein QXT74_01945 [Candidatus Nezhaarchaeales archaeon]